MVSSQQLELAALAFCTGNTSFAQFVFNFNVKFFLKQATIYFTGKITAVEFCGHFKFNCLQLLLIADRTMCSKH